MSDPLQFPRSPTPAEALPRAQRGSRPTPPTSNPSTRHGTPTSAPNPIADTHRINEGRVSPPSPHQERRVPSSSVMQQQPLTSSSPPVTPLPVAQSPLPPVVGGAAVVRGTSFSGQLNPQRLHDATTSNAAVPAHSVVPLLSLSAVPQLDAELEESPAVLSRANSTGASTTPISTKKSSPWLLQRTPSSVVGALSSPRIGFTAATELHPLWSMPQALLRQSSVHQVVSEVVGATATPPPPAEDLATIESPSPSPAPSSGRASPVVAPRPELNEVRRVATPPQVTNVTLVQVDTPQEEQPAGMTQCSSTPPVVSADEGRSISRHTPTGVRSDVEGMASEAGSLATEQPPGRQTEAPPRVDAGNLLTVELTSTGLGTIATDPSAPPPTAPIGVTAAGESVTSAPSYVASSSLGLPTHPDDYLTTSNSILPPPAPPQCFNQTDALDAPFVEVTFVIPTDNDLSFAATSPTMTTSLAGSPASRISPAAARPSHRMESVTAHEASCATSQLFCHLCGVSTDSPQELRYHWLLCEEKCEQMMDVLVAHPLCSVMAYPTHPMRSSITMMTTSDGTDTLADDDERRAFNAHSAAIFTDKLCWCRGCGTGHTMAAILHHVQHACPRHLKTSSQCTLTIEHHLTPGEREQEELKEQEWMLGQITEEAHKRLLLGDFDWGDRWGHGHHSAACVRPRSRSKLSPSTAAASPPPQVRQASNTYRRSSSPQGWRR